MSGYIKLHRRWHDSSAFRDEAFCQRAAWVWLLTNCAWKDCTRRDPHGHLTEVKRGQLHTSSRALGQVWGWSKNKVERFLRDLEKCQNVDRKTDQHGMLITVRNYEKYQGSVDAGGPKEGTETDQARTTQEEGIRKKEEDKKGGYAFAGKVIKLTFADFRAWQTSYPDLDLRANLQSRDDWLALQDDTAKKRWFLSTSSWLARRQQDEQITRSEKDAFARSWL